jgi:hypothetical protein
LPGKQIPSDFTLHQNYPNPFNPTTQINYSLQRKAKVSLKVYNVVGEEIMTLFDGVRNPGNYTVALDAKNLAGGIYFYTLKSESATITKKLVLIK